MKRCILVVNPGSTSTKFALYEEKDLLFEKNLPHSVKELSGFSRISDQFSFRKKLIMNELEKRGVDLESIKVVVGRGGLLKPIPSGIYKVNDAMKSDLLNSDRGEHASNLGGLIADDIAADLPSALAYIVDPVVVDEMDDIARYAGHPAFSRISIFHALNQKAVARMYASTIGRNYEDINLIVAHMGGGISVGAHRRGKVVDVNNGLNGDGPFSPERSGGLPAAQLVDLCFSGEKSKEEVHKMLIGQGGLVAYLQTNDFREVCNRAQEGDITALALQEALSYQVGKEIGALGAVLKGRVDAIILTGGMAYQKSHTDYISDMVSHLAEIVLFPGEDELWALAFNGLMALDGEAEVKEYH
ncbi:MAG: butyrate kinase [Bacteroidia bacterium]|nr:MAG: butyrate kinase [Bacteroidia bacterium]